jgi:hypothetical protein
MSSPGLALGRPTIPVIGCVVGDGVGLGPYGVLDDERSHGSSGAACLCLSWTKSPSGGGNERSAARSSQSRRLAQAPARRSDQVIRPGRTVRVQKLVRRLRAQDETSFVTNAHSRGDRRARDRSVDEWLSPRPEKCWGFGAEVGEYSCLRPAEPIPREGMGIPERRSCLK